MKWLLISVLLLSGCATARLEVSVGKDWSQIETEPFDSLTTEVKIVCHQ